MYLVVSYDHIDSFYYIEHKLAIFSEQQDALDYACEYFKREWRKEARTTVLAWKYDSDFPFFKRLPSIEGIKVYEFDTKTLLFEELWQKEIEPIDISDRW